MSATAALVSWGVALAEYLLQMPANRIGYTTMNRGQLKILEEVISLSVFVPFAVLSMMQPLKLNYLWAALCIFAAVIPASCRIIDHTTTTRRPHDDHTTTTRRPHDDYAERDR